MTSIAGAVVRSGEFRRIEALPRRRWEDDAKGWTTALERALLVRPDPCGPDCVCPRTLWPAQAAALHDAIEARGLVGPIGVGNGKGLLSMLLPVVLRARRPLLLVPSSMRPIAIRVLAPMTARHWRTHPALEVRGHSELSTVGNAGLLERIDPDVVVIDEAHAFSARGSARTRRLGRFVAARRAEGRPVILVVLSGTLISKSIRDLCHLAEWSLGPGTPVPIPWCEAEDWADALDEAPRDGRVVLPGALSRLCAEGEKPIDGFRRRLLETPGVVGADGVDGVRASLRIRVSPGPAVPAEIREAMARLRETWELPDGHQLMERLDLWRHMRELALGFWSRWDPPAPPVWLEARKAWAAYVRQEIGRRRGIDTEGQVKAACLVLGREAPAEWLAWAEIGPTFEPRSVPVWISDFAVRAAAAWLGDTGAPAGIVWSERPCFGEAVAREAAVRYYGAGDEAAVEIETKASGPIVASVDAHGTGRNLQFRWARNLCPAPWPGGKIWEQAIARTHRTGQPADEATWDVWTHAPELADAWTDARANARWIERTTGLRQKLNFADVVGG